MFKVVFQSMTVRRRRLLRNGKEMRNSRVQFGYSFQQLGGTNGRIRLFNSNYYYLCRNAKSQASAESGERQQNNCLDFQNIKIKLKSILLHQQYITP